MTNPTVAVVGCSGILGSNIIKALTSPAFRDHYSFPVHALTRDAEKFSDTEDVKYYSTGDFTDPEKNREALKGVDVVIDATNMFVDIRKLADSIAEAGIKTFFLAAYGSTPEKYKYKDIFIRHHYIDYARSLGLRVPRLHVGGFTRVTLTFTTAFGIDTESKSFERIAGGDIKIGFTSEVDVARSLVSLAYRQDNAPDDTFVNGSQLTHNELLALYERLTGKKLAVKDISREDAEKRADESYNKGMANLDMKDFENIVKALTIQDGVFTYKDHNELVNPGLWEWEQYEDLAELYWKKE